MKASELIAQLTESISVHGDVDVVYPLKHPENGGLVICPVEVVKNAELTRNSDGLRNHVIVVGSNR